MGLGTVTFPSDTMRFLHRHPQSDRVAVRAAPCASGGSPWIRAVMELACQALPPASCWRGCPALREEGAGRGSCRHAGSSKVGRLEMEHLAGRYWVPQAVHRLQSLPEVGWARTSPLINAHPQVFLWRKGRAVGSSTCDRRTRRPAESWPHEACLCCPREPSSALPPPPHEALTLSQRFPSTSVCQMDRCSHLCSG